MKKKKLRTSRRTAHGPTLACVPIYQVHPTHRFRAITSAPKRALVTSAYAVGSICWHDWGGMYPILYQVLLRGTIVNTVGPNIVCEENGIYRFSCLP